jgi:hypothetical protein
MNFENLGAKIKENEAWNQKIWAQEAFRGKTVFLGGSGAILEFLELLEGLGAKDRGSCRIWIFLGDFWSLWSGLGPICNYVSELRDPSAIFLTRRDRGLIYNNLGDLFAKR